MQNWEFRANYALPMRIQEYQIYGTIEANFGEYNN
jgi:hypothetical protein